MSADAPTTPEPTAPAAPAAPATSIQGGGDWGAMRSSLPEDLKGNPLLDPFGEGDQPSGFEGLVREHISVQHLIGGEKVARPTEKSSPEDWDRFFNQMGRPENAESYDFGDFQPPENVPWDGELQKGLVEDIHAAGLSNAQANQLMRAYASRQAEAHEAALVTSNQAHESMEDSLRNEWGLEYDANLALTMKAFNTAFGEGAGTVAEIQLPDGSLLGDHPAFIRGFFELAGRMREDSFIEGSRSAQQRGFNPKQALEELETIERDPNMRALIAMRDHSDPERKVLMARMDALSKAAYPE